MPLPFNPITVEQTGSASVDRRRVLHSALDTLLDALEQSGAPVTDELVPITRAALEKLNLEYQPILGFAQAGTLPTVWIGRRRYTKRSSLVALADTLPAAVDAEPTDDIAVAAAKRAARKVSR